MSSTSRIEVNSSTIRQKAGELRQKNGAFQEKVGQLQTAEKALDSMWDGDAQAAFHRAFTTDVKKFDQFHKAIEKYAKALEHIAEEYEKTEKANVGIATSRK